MDKSLEILFFSGWNPPCLLLQFLSTLHDEYMLNLQQKYYWVYNTKSIGFPDRHQPSILRCQPTVIPMTSWCHMQDSTFTCMKSPNIFRRGQGKSIEQSWYLLRTPYFSIYILMNQLHNTHIVVPHPIGLSEILAAEVEWNCFLKLVQICYGIIPFLYACTVSFVQNLQQLPIFVSLRKKLMVSFW